MPGNEGPDAQLPSRQLMLPYPACKPRSKYSCIFQTRSKSKQNKYSLSLAHANLRSKTLSFLSYVKSGSVLNKDLSTYNPSLKPLKQSMSNNLRMSF